MWKLLDNLKDIKYALHCDQCGTSLPALRNDSRCIQTFRWTCSPACYEAFVDELVGQASPGEEYQDGTDWDCALVNAAGTVVHSLRYQLEEAMSQFRENFDPTGRLPNCDRQPQRPETH